MIITKKLEMLKDSKHAAFVSSLVPNISKDKFLGIKTPILRSIAKDFQDNEESKKFLTKIPHKYFEENMLHVMFINQMKDYDLAIDNIQKFLPYIDNWAVCDALNPKILFKNKSKLLENIQKWIVSKDVYTCRFGIEMLMKGFLDDDFKSEYLSLPLKSNIEDYYVQMMQAWFYQVALVKKWDEAIIYLEKRMLSPFVHNKTIQKSKESFRISLEQKQYLENLK